MNEGQQPRIRSDALRSDALRSDALRALAKPFGASHDDSVIELLTGTTVRTFRVGSVVIRTDMDETGTGLAREAQALGALETATEDALAPAVRRSALVSLGGRARPTLIYDSVEGTFLDATRSRSRSADVGALFARLHGAHVLDLVHRFSERGAKTLLLEFKRASDDLKTWTLAREADGLGPDLLTLTLADLQRNLRPFVLAQDHHFLVQARRTLCHGAATPEVVVERQTDRALLLTQFDRAHIGDPARDLAHFSHASQFSDDEEDAMLCAYEDTLAALGRPDPTFLWRYFARRTVALFSLPMARLRNIVALKKRDKIDIEDRIQALVDEVARAQRDLVRAMNGLQDLTGHTRPIALREVTAMGRLVAFEELLLDGKAFSIALMGDAYTGKTEVGSTLARRLDYAYVNTGALGRALALLERERLAANESVAPTTLVRTLFENAFALVAQAEAPFYYATLGDTDVTGELHDEVDSVRGATLVDDESVRACLRDELTRRHAGRGIVCEGPYAHTLLPGPVRDFHLMCDLSVRRARLMQHRPELQNEDEANALLAQLDQSKEAKTSTAVVIDLELRPASAGALDIIRSLVPGETSETDSLSGRAPLFSD